MTSREKMKVYIWKCQAFQESTVCSNETIFNPETQKKIMVHLKSIAQIQIWPCPLKCCFFFHSFFFTHFHFYLGTKPQIFCMTDISLLARLFQFSLICKQAIFLYWRLSMWVVFSSYDGVVLELGSAVRILPSGRQKPCYIFVINRSFFVCLITAAACICSPSLRQLFKI